MALGACVAAGGARAAVAQQVQSGTAVSNANGVVSIAIAPVDPAASVLFFGIRSNSNRPVGSELRGRLPTACSNPCGTLEFERVTDAVAPEPAPIEIKWYVVTFATGVRVQRGETVVVPTVVDVGISPVASLSQAFVLWSVSAGVSDIIWGSDDSTLAELTTSSNLQFRQGNAATQVHTVAWQVVEFTDAADVNVQKGSVATMSGGATSVTASLGTSVDPAHTFVLAGVRITSDGLEADIGSKMVRARLTSSTTITFDRSIANSVGMDEIGWQAIELKDGSTVRSGNASLPAGVSTATEALSPPVDSARSVAFASTQQGGGQSVGRSPYAGDDIIGVASVTAELGATGTPSSSLVLQRDSTAAAADVGWFVVQFAGSPGVRVGSFAKSTGGAPATQAVAHGLGSVPKAVIFWTDARTDEAFGAGENLAYGVTDGVTSGSFATASQNGVSPSVSARRAAPKALTIVSPTQVVLAEADLQSWSPASFTLQWTTNNALAYIVHYMAIGGADVSAKVANWQMSTATGNSPVTGVGFQPSAVVHLYAGVGLSSPPPSSSDESGLGLGVMDSSGGQWATEARSSPTSAPTVTARGQATDAALLCVGAGPIVSYRASFVSMDVDGFTTNCSKAAGNTGQVYSLALKGLDVKAGSFLKSPNSVGSSATFVQQAAQLKVGAVHSLTFPSSSTPGNLVVVSMNSSAVAASVVSVADNKGNVYSLGAGPTSWNVDLERASTYYASNITTSGSPVTVTVTLASSTTLELYLAEYSGVWPSGPLDQVSTGLGSGSAMNSGSKTTTYPDELVFNFGVISGTGTIGPTFNARSTFNNNFIGDKGVTAIGNYNADGTNLGTWTWVIQMLTFKVGAIQSVGGMSFSPRAVLLHSVQDLAQASPVAQARVGIGASDGVTRGCSAFEDLNAQATSNVQSIDRTSKVFVKVNNGTPAIDAEADLFSLDPGGFTLNWTTNDTAQTQILYLAIAPQAGLPADAGIDAGALDGGCPSPLSVVRDANLFAAVGTPYQLNATGQVGVTGGAGPIAFASCAGPVVAGFQVDRATGLTAWTPAAAGTVTLCLQAQDACSSDSYTFDVVVVAAASSPPVARITASPPAASVSESILFSGATSTASPGAALVSFQWDFGDGALGNGVDLSHSYALPGGYTVYLTVTDNYGSLGSTSVGVVVGDAECPSPPVVQVLADSLHGTDSLTVKFGCNCANGVARAWDFGDGTGSSEAEPSHTYGPGRYRVSLWGVDENGCVGSDEVEVVVDSPPYLPPICRASASPGAGRAPLPVTFTAAYVDPNPGGLISLAEWTFVDDGSTRLEPVVRRTFDTPATYRATLRVENNLGLTCTDRVDVVVQTATGETPPQIFTVPSKEATCRAAYHYAKELEDRPLARGTRPVYWYSGTGTPRALAVDRATGQVLWTPSEAGLERISLIASNSAGTAGQSYEVDVTCSAPERPIRIGCGCQGAEGGLAGLALAALAILKRRGVRHP